MVDKAADGWRVRLLNEMHSRGLTYRKVSEASGIPYTTVQNNMGGNASFESLTFIRRVCLATGIPMAKVLFGVEALEEAVHQVPVLDHGLIGKWLTAEPIRREIDTWLPYPATFATGLRVFALEVQSSDLAPLWPVGSWLYIDPELLPEDGRRCLVLARVPNGGYLIRWLERLAGDDWLVPETAIHRSVMLGNGRVLGSVIGGLKSVRL